MTTVRPRRCVGGSALPLEPFMPVGCFYPREQWDSTWEGMLTPSAFVSAVRAEVLVSERRGPRGGRWWAVASAEAWRAWAEKYVARCIKIEAGKAAAALGFKRARGNP